MQGQDANNAAFGDGWRHPVVAIAAFLGGFGLAMSRIPYAARVAGRVVAPLFRAAVTAAVFLAPTAPVFAHGFDAAGIAYAHGNYATALNLYQIAALDGDISAYKSLGLMYQYGNGVPTDLATAAQYYKFGAKAGDAGSEEALGELFYYGEGTPKDIAEAFKLFSAAAVSHDARAESHLADMYESGEGVAQSDSEAKKYRLLAADPGTPLRRNTIRGAETSASPSSAGQSVASVGRINVQGNQGTGNLASVVRPTYAEPALPPDRRPLGFTSPGPSENVTIVNPTIVPLGQPGKIVPSGQTIKLSQRYGDFFTTAAVDGTELNFIVDSGAAGVSIPSGVVDELLKSGALKHSDFTGLQFVVQADGRLFLTVTFKIALLTIGSLQVKNVSAFLGAASSTPLLGETFLKKFRSWSIDNSANTLTISEY